MTSAAYPTVIAALFSTADEALSSDSFRVVRGFDLSDDPSDVMMIGVPSLSDVNSISAGSFSQEFATLGTPRSRDENGTINGVVMARNGQGDQQAATEAAFGYVAGLEAALRADPAMGVTDFAYLVAQMSTGDVAEDQVDGATTAISFTVAYRARI